MTIWFRQHISAIKTALGHIRTNPGNFAFNVLVVAIALALPIAGLTLVENIRPISSQIVMEPEISVFTHTSTDRAGSIALQEPIKAVLKDAQAKGKVRFVAKDSALTSMEKTSNLAEVLATLGENPLPDAYVISLTNADTDKIEQITQNLKSLPEVDIVQVDSAWVKRLAALLAIAQTALLFLAIMLGLVVVVVVFNATRLQVISHQAEISISRLLGATNMYIHRPYYYTGALLGILSGGLALAIIAVCLHPLNQSISDFARLYESEFHLTPLGIVPSLILLGASVILALSGVLLSVRRQMARAA